MAPNPVDSSIVDAVATYADAGDFESAIWWSERLYAAAPTLENLLRLAQYILQSNNALRAYGLLKGYQPAPGATDESRERRRRFLFARTCLLLGHYQEAEHVLLEPEQPGVKPSAVNPDSIPNGACGLYLLGQICMKQNRRAAALAYFSRCLEADRNHWGAYAAMCQMGAAQPDLFQLDSDHHSTVSAAPAPPPIQSLLSPVTATVATSLDFSTPQNQSNITSNDVSGDETPLKSAPASFRKPPLGSIRKAQARMNRDTPGTRTPRRSERLLFTGSTPAPSDRSSELKAFAERGNHTPVERAARRSTKRGKERITPGECDLTQHCSSTSLSQVISTISEAYRLLHLYQCQEAIDAFHKLPESHFNSHWILVHLGRAHFELNHYQKACQVFEKARELDPYNMNGIEIYSTALWQLKQEVKLAFLAQQTLSMTRMSPEPWIAIGNCFSLQKEHDTAIKFFERATQLDPGRTYAYTLMAHEYIANEDFEKAIAAFRNAIRVDERHYNAWYGLGTIYYRQEKYQLAIYHFLRAIKINSRNSVLECYLGMVLHASQKLEESLIHLDKSCQLEPKNLLPKFQKASVLFSMEDYDAAMEELEQLADLAPREASVHFLMGRICKKRGELVNALLHFTVCLDLDPNDRNLVKANIERLYSVHPSRDFDDSTDDDGATIAAF